MAEFLWLAEFLELKINAVYMYTISVNNFVLSGMKLMLKLRHSLM